MREQRTYNEMKKYSLGNILRTQTDVNFKYLQIRAASSLIILKM